MTPFRARDTNLVKLASENMFRVVPIVAPDVEVRVAEDGSFHVRRTIRASGRIGAFLQHRLGWRRERLVNLDQRGTAFWKLVNGKRSLASIARILTSDWGRDPAECRQATLAYMHSLAIRGFIVLRSDAIRKDAPTP